MGLTRTPRSQWIEEGLRALSAGGPDAVRIESLAQALGVSKGGFYGHFGNRNMLLTEMLDIWERAATQGVIEQVETGGGDAKAKLERLFAIVSSGEAPMTGTEVDLAIRDWARRDEAVAQRLKRADNRRMGYLRQLFGPICVDADDVEARCMLVFSLRIGNHFIAADHGDRSRAEVMKLTARWLLR